MSVYKRPGADVYSYDFQYRGRRFSGTTGETSKREAQRAERDAKEALRKAEFDPSKPLTFAQAASLYWTEVGQHHRNGDTTLRNLAWLEAAIGSGTMLADINERLIARLVAKRRGEPIRQAKTDKAAEPRLVSPATVNRTVIEPLSGILRRAADVWGAKVQRIDWRRHTLAEPEERVREASPNEETELLDAMRSDYAAAVRFAILTGCRRAEIVDLEWTSVDLINRAFRVTGKGDRSRTIPMTGTVFDLLWSLKDHHKSAVFTYEAVKARDGRERGKRYPITIEGFKTAWRRSRAKTDVEDFRFHDTRHTSATRLVRATGNLRLAQRLLGHSNITTTTKYAHVTHEDLRAGLEAVAAAGTPTPNTTLDRESVGK